MRGSQANRRVNGIQERGGRTWRRLAALGAVLILSGALAACGSDDETPAPGGTGTSGSSGSAEDISGAITVLTNRTDMEASGKLDEYAAAFNEVYPDVEVTFEAITDYEGEVTIRMNTADYGDVLLIPAAITPDQLPDFFEPLGTIDDLGQKYRFINEQAIDGQVYGLATFGNANGFVYNKKIFEEAGITALPATPEEFLADLQLVKDNTKAIPYYTNYADGWPLTQWESDRCGITGDPNCVNDLAHTDAPWTKGSDHFVIDTLLYDIVAGGLSEEDPTTTSWEDSKLLLGSGKIASMELGSWAVIQMQDAADNPDDIGYMPFPSTVDGTYYSPAAGDWKIAINKNSENKEAARAWLDWFLDQSTFAADSGAIPPLIDAALPDQLSAFQDLGVSLLEYPPAPEGEVGLVNNIDDAAEIGLFQPTYRQRIVDAARGATDESLQDIFDDLNSRWAAARASLGG